MALAICGESTTLGSARRGAGTCGSVANTSRPAPAMAPLARRSIKAGSSTTEPREILMKTPRGPSASSTEALTRCRVALPPGTAAISTSLHCARAVGEGKNV
ncbi:hypothetical protein D3C86_1566140 [compost metagenome]